jgi:hypothetical protein
LLNRIFLFKKQKNILITDSEKNLLILCNLNGQREDTISLAKHLSCPRGLFVSPKEEEIYILDYLAGSIFIFNKNFELIKRIGENIIKPSFLSVDLESQLVYVSSLFCDEISILDSIYGKLINKISVISPLHTKIYENLLFVISMIDCDYEGFDRKKILEIKNGNYISVINRQSLELIRKIEFNDWFDPWSLHMTRDMTLYTIAKEIDNKGFVSEDYFLFKIDSNYKIKQKIQLENTSSFNDALYLENKIILCGIGKNKFLNQIKIIQFN